MEMLIILVSEIRVSMSWWLWVDKLVVRFGMVIEKGMLIREKIEVSKLVLWLDRFVWMVMVGS